MYKVLITPVGLILLTVLVLKRLIKGPLEKNGPSITNIPSKFQWWCSSTTSYVFHNTQDMAMCALAFQRYCHGQWNIMALCDWIYSDGHCQMSYVKTKKGIYDVFTS